jgi:hypothetical protein
MALKLLDSLDPERQAIIHELVEAGEELRRLEREEREREEPRPMTRELEQATARHKKARMEVLALAYPLKP